MLYYDVVVNVPLFQTYTYSHPTPLDTGQRVVVSFRGKKVIALIWQQNAKPDFDPEKILPIEQAFSEQTILNAKWRELIDFCARYYHYPIGQTAFAALPKGLRQTKPLNLKQPEQFLCLNDQGKVQPDPKTAHKQKYALWQQLKTIGGLLSELKQDYPQAKKYIDQWRSSGWLTESKAPQPTIENTNPLTLNDDQQAAYQVIQAQTGQFAPFLLFGITGSGKTEVYFACMDQALAQGKQVLFLLPEISLTPQLLQRVRQRFSQYRHAILHSQIADGARTQGFVDASYGQQQLIIGTRLSVFTPLHNLGLIVVDEEHDHSFKQEDDLRYHARDLALWRARQANCPIILGSATPSLESYHKALEGKYQLLTLHARANIEARLPKIHIEDVRRQKLDNGFSAQAMRLLQENQQKGGLSLVYLNRRGFAPALACTDCGYSFGCPHCSAKMVLHKEGMQLRCHHCNYTQAIPLTCPTCGNHDLTALGQGTQRVEETLASFLPHARISRVDRDSTSNKNDWENLYQAVINKEINVLVGTQMLAKGHDFPDLNLVIILNADGGLFSPDFRSEERLFSELMQVSGRAGRADKPGLVLLQTQLPEHPLFAALQQHSYPAFAEAELVKRQMFGFSPFSYSAAIRADALNIGQALHFLVQIKNEIVVLSDITISGPAPAFMMRLAQRERAQLFVESANRKALHQTIQNIIPLLQEKSKQYKDMRWSVDVDPITS